jgi:hypothetical protein
MMFQTLHKSKPEKNSEFGKFFFAHHLNNSTISSQGPQSCCAMNFRFERHHQILMARDIPAHLASGFYVLNKLKDQLDVSSQPQAI